MMALTQENVHYTLNSGPGTCAVPGFFVRGGGGGGARKQSGQCLFLVINLFHSLQSGSNGFITEGRRGSNFFQGVSKETDITCDFPGGGGGGGGGGGPDP